MSVSKIAFHSTVMSANIFWKIAGRVVCNSSKIVRNCPIESPALAELRRAHADSTAVAEFVDVIQQVNNIEPDLEQTDVRDLQISLQGQIDGRVLRHGLDVGKTPVKSTAVEDVESAFPILPGAGTAGRRSNALLVIEIDPVILDKFHLFRSEQELRRGPRNPPGRYPPDVARGIKR